MSLVELSDKLQELCHEGLSNLDVTINGKKKICFELEVKSKTINIRAEK